MRPSLKDFKKKALANPDVEQEYVDLAPAYALRKQLIEIRKNAGLTQEELARLSMDDQENYRKTNEARYRQELLDQMNAKKRIR